MSNPHDLHPPSTLLIGPAGTGKTTSLVTLVAAGLKLRMLATEPSAPARVISELEKRKLPIDSFDWAFVSPATASWDALREAAQIINTRSLKDIADMRTGIAKSQSDQWLRFLDTMNNFRSERTGTALGDISTWLDDSAFTIDGLSGVNNMSRNLTVGLKPNPAPGEWGVMQNNILMVIDKLTADLRCFFVCIAHVEREQNELTGVSQITVSTLGAKLAPKLPPKFTNVVFAKKQLDKFFWSTAESGVDTKNGDLPLSDSLSPTFQPIVDAYRARQKATSASVATPNVVPHPATKPQQ